MSRTVPERRLIVNADDFGAAPGVNLGIVQAHRQGIVTSATLMANMAFFDQAVEMAGRCPELGVGVHLNLNMGRPLLPPEQVPALVNADGSFRSSPARLLLVPADQIEAELTAQVERVLRAGVVPTHLDGHKHIQALPNVLSAALRVAKRFAIRRLRSPGEPVRLGISLSAGGGRKLLISLLSRSARARIQRESLFTNDQLAGVALQGRWSLAALESLIRRLPPGVTELMCHPGLVDNELRSLPFRMLEEREVELAVLVNPEARRMVEQAGVELASYRGCCESG